MRWIIVLRGVNVGGHARIPMAALRQTLTAAGADNVASYIQSGNLILDHKITDPAHMADWISDLIQIDFGHRPAALAFTGSEFQSLLSANPFTHFDDAKHIHAHLFRLPPDPQRLLKLIQSAPEDEFLGLTDMALYHHTPNGFGRSKMAARIARDLAVPTTARNLNSLRKIADLI